MSYNMSYIQEEIDRLKRINEEDYPLNARGKAKLEEFEHLLFLAEKEKYDKQINYSGSFLIEEIDDKRESYSDVARNEIQNKNEELIINDLSCCDYWCSSEWIQPPVRIKHGDLVDVKCENYSLPLLGRYIGKGYGVVELYNYATGISYVTGKVVSRGLNKNPRLISDEKLFDFIDD